MMLYINFPSWINPEIIPGLPVRWYGLMYLIAFGITYFLIKKRIKKDKLVITDDNLSDLFFWVILGLILGARILAVTVYDTSGRYISQPWLIFWPFDNQMNFTGIQGMSYHGGVLGGLIAGLIYTKLKKQSFFQWVDIVCVSIPLGYTFGRLGNFINGELYGRVTLSSFGIIFPQARKFSVKIQWVKEMALNLNLDVQNGMVNLPRHASQLYESLFEGALLWLFLWFIIYPKNKIKGSLFGYYLMFYGFVRFIIEYFREPDAELGYILQLGKSSGSIHKFETFLNFSMGQLLCLIMIVTGFIYCLTLKILSERNIKKCSFL